MTYVHPADGPHEMMIYVQTTTDVNIVMAKVDALAQKYYGGRHEIPIGIISDKSPPDGPTWPFAWYLRDYTHVCFQFPAGCADTAKDIPVLLTGGGDSLPLTQQQYGATYLSHRYQMRTWWDEGYKPLDGGGIGPWLWLSYGDVPPPGASFDLGKSASNIWQWWWYRRAIGSTQGSYDMGLFIRKDLGITP